MKALALLGLISLTGCDRVYSFKVHSAYELCEKGLSKSLVSPGSLRILWKHYNDSAPITWEETNTPSSVLSKTELSKMDDLNQFMYRYSKTLDESERNLPREKHVAWPRFVEVVQNKPTGSVYFQYDSENIMGAPIRGYFYCRMGARDGKTFSYVFARSQIPNDEGESMKAVFNH